MRHSIKNAAISFAMAIGVSVPAAAQGIGDCPDLYKQIRKNPLNEAKIEAKRSGPKLLFATPQDGGGFVGLSSTDLSDPIVKRWISHRFRSMAWPDYPCGSYRYEDVLTWGERYNLELLRITRRGRFRS